MSYNMLMWLAIALGVSTFVMILVTFALLAATGAAGYFLFRSFSEIAELNEELVVSEVTQEDLEFVFEPIKDVDVLFRVMNDMEKFKGEPILENMGAAINSAVVDIEQFMEKYEVSHENLEKRKKYIKDQLKGL